MSYSFDEPDPMERPDDIPELRSISPDKDECSRLMHRIRRNARFAPGRAGRGKREGAV